MGCARGSTILANSSVRCASLDGEVELGGDFVYIGRIWVYIGRDGCILHGIMLGSTSETGSVRCATIVVYFGANTGEFWLQSEDQVSMK